PREYREMMLTLRTGQQISRREILEALVRIQYSRNDYEFTRGTFRVRGDVVEVYPAYDEQAIRIELWGDEIERISRFDPLTGETIVRLPRTAIYPATHFVTQRPTIERAVERIRAELGERRAERGSGGKRPEWQRVEARGNSGSERLLEPGTCRELQNYAR